MLCCILSKKDTVTIMERFETHLSALSSKKPL